MASCILVYTWKMDYYRIFVHYFFRTFAYHWIFVYKCILGYPWNLVYTWIFVYNWIYVYRTYFFQIPSFLFFTEIECTVNNILSGFMYSSLHLKNWLLPNFRLLFFQIFWIPLNFRLPVYFRLPLKFGLHLNFRLQLNLCLQNICL